MKVITLDEVGLNQSCKSLAMKIDESSDVIALVGVRTGGAVVATLVYDFLVKANDGLQYYEVGASRYASTAKNSDEVSYLFKYLPRFMLNILRVIEHYLVSIRMLIFSTVDRSICMDDRLAEFLVGRTSGVLYIIDDAIDSGSTIKHLLGALYSINPKLDYKVAVLVVTQKNALVSPDVSLFENVLLRYPWSSDYIT